jgi:hypothetical protein
MRLAEYNLEDVMNLEPLLEAAANLRIERLRALLREARPWERRRG